MENQRAQLEEEKVELEKLFGKEKEGHAFMKRELEVLKNERDWKELSDAKIMQELEIKLETTVWEKKDIEI
jgi:peptidoglycan hydrolase CwlO-like protein